MLEIRRNTSGVFDSPPITQSTVVGSAVLRAEDCNRATLSFDFFGDEAYGLLHRGPFGVLPLTRLTGGAFPCQSPAGLNVPRRDARPPAAGFDSRQSGAWFESATSGQGFMLSVQPPRTDAPGTFTYDAGTPNDATSQHWLTLAGETRADGQAGTLPVVIYRTLGGKLASVPTENSFAVGNGLISFTGCDKAVFSYQFLDALIVGAFRGRSGEIALTRLGNCVPP